MTVPIDPPQPDPEWDFGRGVEDTEPPVTKESGNAEDKDSQVGEAGSGEEVRTEPGA